MCVVFALAVLHTPSIMAGLLAKDVMRRSEPLGERDLGRAAPDTPLPTLAENMLDGGYEATLIFENGTVVGLVLWQDVVRGLLHLVRDEAPSATTTPAGPAITLKLRRMATGEKLLAELASFDDAKTWLATRPSGLEVMGVASPALTAAQEAELHQVMRPLDEEDRDAQRQFDAWLEQRRRASLSELQAEGLQELSVRFEAAPRPPEEPDRSGG